MAESGQSVKAVLVIDEGPVFMKSLTSFCFRMINGQVLEKKITYF